MKNYFKDLFNRFVHASIYKKILIFLLILLYIFVMVICLKKVNVEVMTPGVINNPLSSIDIESDEENKYIGTIGIYTYKRISLLQYWLSINNNEFSVSKIDSSTDISEKEELAQGIIMKDNSITCALINAYREASKINSQVTIENIDSLYKGVTVATIYSYAKTQLKIGDLIVAVNGEKFQNYEEFREICSRLQNDHNYLSFSVVRDDKEINATADYVINDNRKVLGIVLDETYEMPKTSPEYTINSNYSSIGPSGGAMTALAIYDKLTSGDITKGKKIVGTGTINFDGTIGAIGGIEQKIVTAKNYGIDIFFVDSYDYQDALKACKLHKTKFELVEVKTFTDIINYLNALEE